MIPFWAANLTTLPADAPVITAHGIPAGTAIDVLSLFLALAAMLGLARVLGEVVRRFNQPTVLGELLAGLILGPTVLARVRPEWFAFLFPPRGGLAGGGNEVVLEGLTTLAIALFLFVAGLEVDLSRIWRQGKTALTVSITGMIVPFTLGFIPAYYLPQWLGAEPHADRLIFALMLATALSISALPVIAKTLMDLNLYRTDLGMVTIAAAIVNDLGGWIIFAVVLGMMGATQGHANSPTHTIWLTLGYTAGMLTLGRWLIHRILPWIQAHLSWPGGIIGFTLGLALFGAAFTEWIGVHAIFGAFIVGVAVGDSIHLREATRRTLHQFISFFFAPLFFASIGLKVDFLAQFDPLLVGIVLTIACAGKILGCGLAARWTGMDQREAWGIGLAMNARGAMEIVLGLLALQAGLINQRLFVALVIMAIVTSLIAGPLITRLLRRQRPRRFVDYIASRAFAPQLKSTDRFAVIEELTQLLAPLTGRLPAALRESVTEREMQMSTGLVHGVAVPHARIHGLAAPLIAVGISEPGVDFESADGRPAHLIFLVLTPADDAAVQLEILADIAGAFPNAEAQEKASAAQNYTQFLALLRSELNHG